MNNQLIIDIKRPNDIGTMVIRKTGALVKPTKSEAERTWKNLGSWNEFERRFNPVTFEDGEEPWFMDNHLLFSYAYQITCPEEYVWTVCDVDGKLLIFEGYRFVDRFGYIICQNPRALPETKSAYKTYNYE
jgi:hypothetical protein